MTPPLISNPAYIGQWAPRQIPNPAFFEDVHPSHTAPMAAVAIEVWTTNAAIHFDNIVVAHSIDDAFAFADATFGPKHAAELLQKKEDDEREKQQMMKDHIDKEGFRGYIDVFASRIVDFIVGNPFISKSLNILAQTLGGIIGNEGIQLIEENAVGIIVGVTVIFFTSFIYFCCAYLVPRSASEEESAADSADKPEDRATGSTSPENTAASGNEADKEDGEDEEDEDEVDSSPKAATKGKASSPKKSSKKSSRKEK